MTAWKLGRSEQSVLGVKFVQKGMAQNAPNGRSNYGISEICTFIAFLILKGVCYEF